MKKLICIVLAAVALAAAPAANAQLRFGAKVGANFSNLSWDNAKNLEFKGTSLTNFTGGIMAEWIFVAGFGVDASVMYTAKGTKYEVGDNILGDAFESVFGTKEPVSNTIHYIEVPINLKYKLQLPVVEDIVHPAHKIVIIICVHRICQTVIVISRIGYTCKHIARIRICHDNSSRARLQRQLSRRDLKRFDLIIEPSICIDRSV